MTGSLGTLNLEHTVHYLNLSPVWLTLRLTGLIYFMIFEAGQCSDQHFQREQHFEEVRRYCVINKPNHLKDMSTKRQQMEFKPSTVGAGDATASLSNIF